MLGARNNTKQLSQIGRKMKLMSIRIVTTESFMHKLFTSDCYLWRITHLIVVCVRFCLQKCMDTTLDGHNHKPSVIHHKISNVAVFHIVHHFSIYYAFNNSNFLFHFSLVAISCFGFLPLEQQNCNYGERRQNGRPFSKEPLNM